jgi:hypothetical protein
MGTVLDEAQAVMDGLRQENYGDPVETHRRIGRAWGAQLGIDDIPPDIVALMMVQLKAIRQGREKRSRDNLVDAAAYTRIAELASE